MLQILVMKLILHFAVQETLMSYFPKECRCIHVWSYLPFINQSLLQNQVSFYKTVPFATILLFPQVLLHLFRAHVRKS